MKKEKQLESVLVLIGALIVSFWIYKIKIFLLLALILVLIGTVSPYLTEKISWLWMKLSEWIGFVMSKIILSIVFFIFLLPLALISRLFRKDVLSLKKKQNSYYINRNHSYSAKDLKNMW